MKNFKLRSFLHTFFTVALVSLLSVGVTYAWYLSIFHLMGMENKPGNLNASFDFARYDKTNNTWDQVDLSGNLVLDLGEMTNIATLPPNNEHYFKFKMSETSNAQVLYNVIIQDINILVRNEVGTYNLPEVDYYMLNPSQNAFTFYFQMSTTDNSNPTTIFSDYENMPSNKVTERNQGIFPNYTSLDNWTYVMIKPSLKEIQNIIRQIPVEHSPYTLHFDMTFAGEVRTVDA